MMKKNKSTVDNRNGGMASTSVSSSTFRIKSGKQRASNSPGRINKKGRHEWEALGKEAPKKTYEELLDEEVSAEEEESEEEEVVLELPEETIEVPKSSDREKAKNNWSKVAQEVTKEKKKPKKEKSELEDNVEHLLDQVEALQTKNKEYDTIMQKIQESGNENATEAGVAHYLTQIAEGLQRECGDKPYTNKFSEKSHLDRFYRSKDSVKLKEASEKVIDKFLIIGMNLINAKKFKTKAEHQIYNIESQIKKHMEVGEFRKEHEDFEHRIKEWIETKTSALNGKLDEANLKNNQQKMQFEQELAENQKQTLWKMRDFENLMEKRISEHKVNTLLDAIDKKFQNLIRDTDEKQTKFNLDEFKKTEQEIQKLSTKTDYQVQDLKNQAKRHQGEIDNRLVISKYNEMDIVVKGLKNQIEMELDAIQGHVRESKDKCAMLIKRMENFNPVDMPQSQSPGLQMQERPRSNTFMQNDRQDQASSPIKMTTSFAQSPGMKGIAENPRDTITPDSSGSFNIHNDSTQNFGKLNLNIKECKGSDQIMNAIRASTQGKINHMLGIKLQRRMSIRNVDIASISRKEKQDLIDSKVYEFEENMNEIENTLNNMQEEIEHIPTQADYNLLRNDKLSIADIKDHLPNFDQITLEINKMVESKMEHFKVYMEDFRIDTNQRMVKIRQEFDVNTLKKYIDKKADDKEVAYALDQQDGKAKMLDNNVMMLANDLEKFQKILSKMNKQLIDLQEINKDVLLGKKNPNCLSCSKMNDNFENVQQIQGKNGQLFQRSGAARTASNFGKNKIEEYEDPFMENDRSTPQTMSPKIVTRGDRKRGSSYVFTSGQTTTQSRIVESQRMMNQLDNHLERPVASNRHIKSKSSINGANERQKKLTRTNNLSNVGGQYDNVYYNSINGTLDEAAQRMTQMTQSQKLLYQGMSQKKQGSLPISFKVLNGAKQSNYAGDLQQPGTQTSKAMRTRPMTGKVQTQGQHVTGLSQGLWSFSNLNTISQQNMPPNQQYSNKQSSNQINNAQNQFSVVEIRQSEATASTRPTKAVPTMLHTEINNSQAIQNGEFMVMNNSAFQEASNQVVTKFLIGSDSASLVQRQSRENLIHDQGSPGTAMNLNENSQAIGEGINDPTQIIFIQPTMHSPEQEDQQQQF